MGEKIIDEVFSELDEHELIELSSIYGMALLDHKDLMALAIAKKMTVAEAYLECKRAQRQIAERVQQLKKKEEERKKMLQVAQAIQEEREKERK